MKRKHTRRLLTLLLTGALVLAMAVPALAQEWGSDQKGSLTVHCLYPAGGSPVAGLPVTLYRVGTIDRDGYLGWNDQTRNLNLQLNQKGQQAWDMLAKDLRTRIAPDWVKTDTVKSGTDGSVTFPDLEPGLYLGVVDTVKIGNTTYTTAPFLVTVPLRKDAASPWEFDAHAYPKLERDTPPPPGDDTVSYSVEKKWVDEGFEAERPKEIKVQLYRGSKPYGKPVTLTEENGWKWKWDNLPTPKSDYHVSELETDGYTTASAPGTGKTDQVITNSKRPEFKSTIITVKKVWADSDDQEKLRPAEITVQLNRQKEGETSVTAYQEVTLNEANGWTYTWEDLPEDSTWSLEEVRVPEGYTCEVTRDGVVFTIRNSHTPKNPEQTKVTVKKVWSDSDNKDNKRPESVKVQLIHLNETTGEKTPRGEAVTLNKDNSWSYTWTDLPELPKGESWTVEETEVPKGYTVKVTVQGTEFTVTNSYTPKTTTPPGKTTKLPQTGQLWWPVPVMAGAGLLLILAGLIRRRTGREKHD